MILSRESLHKLYQENHGFGKVFKHKIVRNFCEDRKNEGFERYAILERLLLVECAYTRNTVNLYETYETLKPYIENLDPSVIPFVLVLCDDNWGSSSFDLLQTVAKVT